MWNDIRDFFVALWGFIVRIVRFLAMLAGVFLALVFFALIVAGALAFLVGIFCGVIAPIITLGGIGQAVQHPGDAFYWLNMAKGAMLLSMLCFALASGLAALCAGLIFDGYEELVAIFPGLANLYNQITNNQPLTPLTRRNRGIDVTRRYVGRVLRTCCLLAAAYLAALGIVELLGGYKHPAALISAVTWLLVFTFLFIAYERRRQRWTENLFLSGAMAIFLAFIAYIIYAEYRSSWWWMDAATMVNNIYNNVYNAMLWVWHWLSGLSLESWMWLGCILFALGISYWWGWNRPGVKALATLLALIFLGATVYMTWPDETKAVLASTKAKIANVTTSSTPTSATSVVPSTAAPGKRGTAPAAAPVAVVPVAPPVPAPVARQVKFGICDCENARIAYNFTWLDQVEPLWGKGVLHPGTGTILESVKDQGIEVAPERILRMKAQKSWDPPYDFHLTLNPDTRVSDGPQGPSYRRTPGTWNQARAKQLGLGGKDGEDPFATWQPLRYLVGPNGQTTYFIYIGDPCPEVAAKLLGIT
jgi:hypothetical protein